MTIIKPGDTLESDDAGVMSLGHRKKDNTFQIIGTDPSESTIVNTIKLGGLIVSLEQADDIVREEADLDSTSTNDFTGFGTPNYQVPAGKTLVIGNTILNTNAKESFGVGYADDATGTNYVELIAKELTSPQNNYSNSTDFVYLIPAEKFPIVRNYASITTGFVVIEAVEFLATEVAASLSLPTRGAFAIDINQAGNEIMRNQPPPGLQGLNLTVPQIQGIKRDYVMGHNLAVDSSVLQDITTFGENYITTPTSLTPMEIVSDDAQDNPSGTGAQRVMIHGLDANWNRKVQFVTLNGLTPVTTDESATTIEFLRINHIHVLSPSPTNSDHVAVGNIELRVVGGGTVFGKIESGGNMELACRYTVPEPFTAFVTSWHASVGKLPNAGDEIVLFLRATSDPELRTLIPNVFIFQDVIHLSRDSSPNTLDPAHPFPPRSEIKVSAKLNGPSGSGLVSASFQLWLVPDVGS